MLDVSHNQLVALPPNIFSELISLRELSLANNSIGTIDKHVFSNLGELQVRTNLTLLNIRRTLVRTILILHFFLQILNLTGNSLDENWIKAGIFSGLGKLTFLDLSSNHISKIEANLFKDLSVLQVRF